MKNLTWLVVVLMQTNSVKAAEESMAQCYSWSAVGKQSSYVYFAGSAYNAAEGKPFFRFNTLSVKPTAGGILLNWVVEETANLQYFLIEHSTDGQSFSPLFEVPVQPGQQGYSFIDTTDRPHQKNLYYRVKAIYPMVVVASPVRKLTA